MKFRRRKTVILGISRDILERFDGNVPDDIDTLMTMKGVGRKTANLVLTEGFGIPAMCVDTHVHRISNRFGYIQTKTPEETEQALRKKLPKERLRYFRFIFVACQLIWMRSIQLLKIMI